VQPLKVKQQRAFRAICSKSLAANFSNLNAAISLQDLRSPPGNRLEALKGDRAGQHSIRVNDQFRICFVWTKDGPKDVEFTDYH
jgi:proteic killer suppression protein